MKKQIENTTQNVPQAGGAEPARPPADAGGAADAAKPALESVTLTALQAENESLKTTIRQTEAHRRITGELTKAGARSPELLFASVRADVQFTDDGSVANAAALVQRLRTSFPEQFGFERPAASIDGGAGVAVRPQLTKEALAKMKPAEIAALDWADVRRVLAAG